MKKIFLTIILSILILSCGASEINFNSEKTLDQWYSETAVMDGDSYWNKIAYPLPPTEGIKVSRLVMEDGTDIDFYFPPDYEEQKNIPVIIFAKKFKKTEDFNIFGRSTLTMEYDISWAHLLAAEGYAVVKYNSDSPYKILTEIIAFLDENKKALRVSSENIGLWSISDNPEVVINFLASENEMNKKIGCSAFFSPSLKVSAAYSFSDMQHVPYFIAIGAEDDAKMNKTAKIFAEKCEDNNLEYEFYEHPTGGHGFTALSADAETEKIISACIEFYNRNLK